MQDKIKLSINYSGKSDIGLVRSENQDSFGKYPIGVLDIYSGKGQLFIIADGMGGHAGGKVASRLAVDTISEVYFNCEYSNPHEAIKFAIEEANKRIFNKAESSDLHLAGMGTTCIVLAIKEDKGAIGHVGDSRIYKIEHNKIEQLTEDHTQVNELLREGVINSKEAKNYPMKTVLARALGTDKKVKVDIIKEITLKAGQCYMLCTDGLGKINPDEILKIVSVNTAKDSCEKLINLANDRGGNDNVTVQVINISSGHQTDIHPENIHKRKKKKSTLIFFLAIVVLLVIIAFLSMNSFPFFDTGKNDIIHPTNFSLNEQFNKVKTDAVESVEKKIEPHETINDNIYLSKNQLLQKANQLFKKGKIENAISMYREILDAEPMHLGALEGLSKSALYYFNKAEQLRYRKKLKDALKYYLKMEELRPGNQKIIDLIKLCEYQIRLNNSKSTN